MLGAEYVDLVGGLKPCLCGGVYVRKARLLASRINVKVLILVCVEVSM